MSPPPVGQRPDNVRHHDCGRTMASPYHSCIYTRAVEHNNSEDSCPRVPPECEIRATQNFLVDFTKDKFLASPSCDGCSHTHVLLV